MTEYGRLRDTKNDWKTFSCKDNNRIRLKKGKGVFYIVSGPMPLKELYASPPSRSVNFGTNTASLGIIKSCWLLHEDYSFTYTPLSIAWYSFIQLSELGHRGENENAQTSKRQQRGFEPGSVECESGVILLSYRAPRKVIVLQR